MLTITDSQNLLTHLQNRELGGTSSINNYKEQLLLKNFKKANHTTTILNGHENPLINFDIKGNLAATLSNDNNVRLWNLDTGKCLWSFTSEQGLNKMGMIKIVQDKIVFSGPQFLNHQEYETIKIIDLKTGFETATIDTPELIVGRTCMVGKRIFGLLLGPLKNYKIGEWDLEGKFTRSIALEPMYQNFTIMNIKDFLVYISDYAVSIHDPMKDQTQRFDLPQYENAKISCLLLDENYLIAGYSTLDERITFCIIDLNTKKQSTIWLPIQNYNTITNHLKNAIINIVGDRERIFLAHSSGQIIVYNIDDNSHTILGEHETPVQDLALEGSMLFSRSKSLLMQPEEIKLWDLSSMKVLSGLEYPYYKKVHFTSEKIFIALEKSFIQKDYLVSHEGEKFSEGSAQEIAEEERAVHDVGCFVQ